MTRVDQVETLLGAEKRKQTKGARSKTDDVIRREVTRVLSVGTVTEDGLLPDHRPAPLMVLCEVRAYVCACVGVFARVWADDPAASMRFACCAEIFKCDTRVRASRCILIR